MPWPFPNNYKTTLKKSKKLFFDPKNGQDDHVTEAKFSSKNPIFGGHQKYFWADTTNKYGHFKSKDKVQTILKQLPNNFEKVKFWHKNTPTHHHQIKTTKRRVEKFETIKNLAVFHVVGLSQDPKGEA